MQQSKKKLHLTKKQFIIAIAAVCGIALIIEAVLLVRMLTKNREKEKGIGDGKEQDPAMTEVSAKENPESFIRKVYKQEGSDGEEALDSIEQFDYDSDGQLCHEYKWDITYYRGEPYILEESVEVYYSYDERGRLIREDRETIQNYPHPNVDARYEQKRIVSYEYKEGDILEVFIQSTDENGNPDYTVEEKYNADGICIARTKYEYFGGTSKKTEEITYNDHGDILSAVYVSINEDGEVWQTDKKTYSYYESGTKKTLSEQSFDGDGLMKEWTEAKYNEYGFEIARSRLEKGNLVPVLVYDENERKSEKTSHTNNADWTYEKLFDEKGRMIKIAESYRSTDEKTGYSETTEGEFFYPEKGDGPTAVRTTYKYVKNERTRNTIEKIYDSSGRILQGNEVSKNGEETRVLYDWNYRDPSHPSRDVMRKRVYRNGIFIRETFYLVYPVAKEEQEEWHWPYGEFERCGHYDIYNQPGDALKSLCEVCEDYITSVGQYHLEPYHEEVYDPETESWSVQIETSFDTAGRIKTLLYHEDDELVVWEFDDHGNQIIVERKRNGENSKTIRCEYTYYKAGETRAH